MPGLVPGIHVLLTAGQDVDARVNPGHDTKVNVCRGDNYNPSTALVMMLRWISFEPP